MNDSVAVVYLARSEAGSARDFKAFAESYKRFSAGAVHDLVVVRKGAATKPGAAAAIALMLAGVNHATVDRDDTGYDIQAYIDLARTLPHEYLCFLNTHSEIAADDWLAKLVTPLRESSTVGMTGATASYESLADSIRIVSKVIWMCASGIIGFDARVAAAFRDPLAQHARDWLSQRLDPSAEAVDLDSPVIRAAFADHWRDAIRPGGPLVGYDQYQPFPNPHLRSNAFVVRRDQFNGLDFKLGNSKADCMRFESGLDGLPTRLEQRGYRSVLVGSDGRPYATAEWPWARAFRQGDQSNVLVRDNQVRAYEMADAAQKDHLRRLAWGGYSDVDTTVFAALGFPQTKGDLRLSPHVRTPSAARAEPLLLSIVIPTRDRVDLLMEALSTLIPQAYANWECIVFDNASTDPVEPRVLAIGDDRIRCVRSSVPLPVTESWNRAIDMARGDYVTLLGDDDGLTPSFMSSIDFIAREHQRPDFVYSSLFQFFHPGVAPWEPAGYVVDLRFGQFFKGRGDIFRLDPRSAREAVSSSMELRQTFAYNMQSFCFERAFLDSLRIGGKVFHSPFPDYYLANVAMGLGKVAVVSPKPLAIAGVSSRSFGFTLFNDEQTRGDILLGSQMDQDAAFPGVAGDLLPGPTYNTNLLLTMRHVETALDGMPVGRASVQQYRKAQLFRTMFPGADRNARPARPVDAETRERLGAAELRWLDEVTTTAIQAANGDAGAATRFEQQRDDASLFGSDPHQTHLDVGSFANLPQLFQAIVDGRISAGPAI